jgi:hypothetical protein
MFLTVIFLDFFGRGWGWVSDNYTQGIFVLCLVSQNMSAGGLVHPGVLLKVLACQLVFEFVYKKASKFVLENQDAISKQIHQNCSIMCTLPDMFVIH